MNFKKLFYAIKNIEESQKEPPKPVKYIRP